MTTFRTPRGENPPKDRARAKNLGEKIPYFSVPPGGRRNALFLDHFSWNFPQKVVIFLKKGFFLQFFSPSPRVFSAQTKLKTQNSKLH